MKRRCYVGSSRAGGFTLVEILIVIVILAILATIIVGKFGGLTDESRQVAFVGDLRNYATAATLYTAMTGNFLEDSSSGDVPTGFENFIDENKWTKGTPIGGVWDAELDSYGIRSGFGVHFTTVDASTPDDAFMLEIDELFDNGDLSSGVFRKIDNNRYYYVLVN